MCEWDHEKRMGSNQMIVTLPDWVSSDRTNRTVSIDRCIVNQIRELWAAGVATLGCCCGHGRQEFIGGGPSVVVAGGVTKAGIDKAIEVLEQTDDRKWRVMQWRIQTVATANN